MNFQKICLIFSQMCQFCYCSIINFTIESACSKNNQQFLEEKNMKLNLKKCIIIAVFSLFAIQAVSSVAAATVNDSDVMICSDIDETTFKI